MPKFLTGRDLAGLLTFIHQDGTVDIGTVAVGDAARKLNISLPTSRKHLRHLASLLASGEGDPLLTRSLLAQLRRDNPPIDALETLARLFYARHRDSHRSHAKSETGRPDYQQLYKTWIDAARKGVPRSLLQIYRSYSDDTVSSREHSGRVKPLGRSAFYAGFKAWQGTQPSADDVSNDTMLVGYARGSLNFASELPQVKARLFLAVMPASGWCYAEIAHGSAYVVPVRTTPPGSSHDRPPAPTLRHWVEAQQRAIEALQRVPLRIEHIPPSAAPVVGLSCKIGASHAFREYTTYRKWAAQCGVRIPERRVQRGRPATPTTAFAEAEAALGQFLEQNGSLSLDHATAAIDRWTELWNCVPEGWQRSRRDLCTVDQPRALPAEAYAYQEWSDCSLPFIDCHVSFRGGYYSVPWSKIADLPAGAPRRLTLAASSDRLTVYLEEELIAEHALIIPDGSGVRYDGRRTAISKHGPHLYSTDRSHIFGLRKMMQNRLKLAERTDELCNGLGGVVSGAVERDGEQQFIWFRRWLETVAGLERTASTTGMRHRLDEFKGKLMKEEQEGAKPEPKQILTGLARLLYS